MKGFGVRDYWQLVRPRIVVMVLFSMAVAACVSGEATPPVAEIVHALAGAAMVIAGAVALNQRLETRGDARMPRTAGRPLPAGRLSGRRVTGFALALSAAGIGYLLTTSHGGVVAVAAAAWVIYVWIYTPLKRVTVWQTPVGAVAGAMPVLIGATVARAPMSPMAAALFLIVCLWQLPHAMAIAWLYREEFARAEVKLATVVDPSGRTAGAVAVVGSVALMFVILIPWKLGAAGWPYAVAALLLGHAYMACSFGFFHRRTDSSARRLLWASLVYLPGLFAALFFL